VKTRDSIGLAVSEVNGCDYCLTVHSFTAEHLAKLPADEIILARKGHASDPKRDAALQLARKVIETRGKASDADLKAVRDAGCTDANVMEIVALVAMHSPQGGSPIESRRPAAPAFPLVIDFQCHGSNRT
jgi:AhpD family alkylhydroperoxidase